MNLGPHQGHSIRCPGNVKPGTRLSVGAKKVRFNRSLFSLESSPAVLTASCSTEKSDVIKMTLQRLVPSQLKPSFSDVKVVRFVTVGPVEFAGPEGLDGPAGTAVAVAMAVPAMPGDAAGAALGLAARKASTTVSTAASEVAEALGPEASVAESEASPTAAAAELVAGAGAVVMIVVVWTGSSTVLGVGLRGAAGLVAGATPPSTGFAPLTSRAVASGAGALADAMALNGSAAAKPPSYSPTAAKIVCDKQTEGAASV